MPRITWASVPAGFAAGACAATIVETSATHMAKVSVLMAPASIVLMERKPYETEHDRTCDDRRASDAVPRADDSGESLGAEPGTARSDSGRPSRRQSGQTHQGSRGERRGGLGRGARSFVASTV